MRKIISTFSMTVITLSLGAAAYAFDTSACPTLRTYVDALWGQVQTCVSVANMNHQSPTVVCEQIMSTYNDYYSNYQSYCLASGDVTNPTCADLGMIGTYPNCMSPATPTPTPNNGTPTPTPNHGTPTPTPTPTTGGGNPTPTPTLGGGNPTPPNPTPTITPYPTPGGDDNPGDDSGACKQQLDSIRAQVDVMVARNASRSEIVHYVNSQHDRLKQVGCGGSDFGHLHQLGK
jgi:hypothetical protein